MNEATGTVTETPKRLGERRQVSVLFTDMVGYTAIVETLGEEKAFHFTRMIYDRLTAAVREHGGAVRGFAGDSIMAVFGIPEALEDGAVRACRAALEIQATFAEAAHTIEAQFGVRPNMRVGVSSGTAILAPIEGEGAEMTVVGNTVNLASRIQTLAPAGGCLICDATRSLVEWLVELSFDGEHQIKGMAKPQKLWRLQSVHEGATRFDASRARGLSRYVGREAELAMMSYGFERSRRALHVLDIVAEAGLGKSRLVFEFLQRAQTEDFVLFTGQCSPDGEQVPFLPIIQIIRSSFRIVDEDGPDEIARKLEGGLRRADLYTAENLGLMLNLLGLKHPEGSLDGLDGVLIGLRTRDVLPALLKAQCRSSKIILLLEDIHWIDSASEELLGKLIEDGEPPNLLILQTRRTEYTPAWHDSTRVSSIALEPLTEDDIRDLVQTRLGVDTLPNALVRQVIDRAEGNPLLGEEILGFFVDQGALRVEAGKVEFDAALGERALPVGIQNLFSARTDRLDPEDRALLQAAAAIGRRFDPGLLSAVSDRPDETGAALRRLQAQDIVYREETSSDYMFKHVLLRDTVYQGLVSERRVELHLAIAKALELRNADRLAEVAETLAYHSSLAGRADLAFRYNALAGEKSLGVFSLGQANRYFAAALALYRQDPECAGNDQFARFLANYALCSNISMRVKTMLELATEVQPFLNRHGDSRDHVLFLHHYLACLTWNGRYLDALNVQKELSAMADRLDDPVARAYALVSELAISCYCAQLSDDAFEWKRREAEAILENVDDAYLKNFFLAHMGWNAVGRGRVAQAHEAAEHMISVGASANDPRSLGYGTAMKALIALTSDDHENALAMSERALSLSRAQFEMSIATVSRQAALVPLKKPGALEAVRRYVETCEERGWTLFRTMPDAMLGIGLVMEGQIAAGLGQIEASIARREKEGYKTAADSQRLLLCEVYLEILSGNGDASLGVLLRNLRSLAGVMLFGEKRILSLVEKVRRNPHFDADGHQIARAEMILGLLHKIRKRREPAIRHLTAARRIVGQSGPSPMLTRIDTALAELQSPKRR